MSVGARVKRSQPIPHNFHPMKGPPMICPLSTPHGESITLRSMPMQNAKKTVECFPKPTQPYNQPKNNNSKHPCYLSSSSVPLLLARASSETTRRRTRTAYMHTRTPGGRLGWFLSRISFLVIRFPTYRWSRSAASVPRKMGACSYCIDPRDPFHNPTKISGH